MIVDVPAFLSGLEIAVEGKNQLTMRRLFPRDFDDLLRFRAKIVTAIGDPEILRLMPDEPWFVEETLREKNFSIGLFQGDVMVAFNSQFWPSTDEELKEMHIYEPMHRRAAADEITYAGGIMVDPALRGGFQKYLMKARLMVAGHVGRDHHVSTVSFANHFSWRNIMEMGGRVIAVHDFDDPRYGPTSRMLMHAWPTPGKLGEDITWVKSVDVDVQRDLLASGMVGSAFRDAGAGFEIGYQTEL